VKASIFSDLCDVADGFERHVRALESGPEKDRLEGLVRRLDAVIDRTVGVTDVLVGEEER
jgi:hypothetical protein